MPDLHPQFPLEGIGVFSSRSGTYRNDKCGAGLAKPRHLNLKQGCPYIVPLSIFDHLRWVDNHLEAGLLVYFDFQFHLSPRPNEVHDFACCDGFFLLILEPLARTLVRHMESAHTELDLLPLVEFILFLGHVVAPNSDR